MFSEGYIARYLSKGNSMPVQIGQDLHLPEQPYVDLVPDVVTDDGKPLVVAATISTEQPLEFPADFDALTEEEKRIFMDKYRFGGIRCRSDIKDRTIPLTKETLDLP